MDSTAVPAKDEFAVYLLASMDFMISLFRKFRRTFLLNENSMFFAFTKDKESD